MDEWGDYSFDFNIWMYYFIGNTLLIVKIKTTIILNWNIHTLYSILLYISTPTIYFECPLLILQTNWREVDRVWTSASFTHSQLLSFEAYSVKYMVQEYLLKSALPGMIFIEEWFPENTASVNGDDYLVAQNANRIIERFMIDCEEVKNRKVNVFMVNTIKIKRIYKFWLIIISLIMHFMEIIDLYFIWILISLFLDLCICLLYLICFPS